MRYAILSDIHGNAYALEAVLADATKREVDAFIFLGDYCSPLPWSNEVIEMIRHIDKATVICGNNEGYFVDLQGKDHTTWTNKQFMPTYWHYRQLRPENLAYILSLPKTASIADETTQIHLSHSSNIFIGKTKLWPFHTSTFRKMMEKEAFNHEEYLKLALDTVLSHPELVDDILALPAGVYLNGHNHLQFHMEYDCKLFINPGSCGASADFNPAASYSILQISDGHPEVEECKVSYDYISVAKTLQQSTFALEMPEWTEIQVRQLLEAKEYTSYFLSHLQATCRRMNLPDAMPVSNEVWDAAIKTWDINAIE